MRYLILLCLSIFLAFSCKNENTTIEETSNHVANTAQTQVEKQYSTVTTPVVGEKSNVTKSIAKKPYTNKVSTTEKETKTVQKPVSKPKATVKKTVPENKMSTKNDSRFDRYKKQSTVVKANQPAPAYNQTKHTTVTHNQQPVVNSTPIQEEQAPMSIIKFDNPILDFGEITEGDVIEHDFVFENTGNAPLQILEADATCGCTTPEIPFLDIPPGGKSKIHIKYNSVNKEGYETPSITIKTNGAPTYFKLKLYGTVKPRADKKPIKLENPALEVEQNKNVKADNKPVPALEVKDM